MNNQTGKLCLTWVYNVYNQFRCLLKKDLLAFNYISVTNTTLNIRYYSILNICKKEAVLYSLKPWTII